MRMMRPDTALLIGTYLAIPLAATDAGLTLKRIFPDSVTVNFVGPVLSAIGVLLVTHCMAPRR